MSNQNSIQTTNETTTQKSVDWFQTLKWISILNCGFLIIFAFIVLLDAWKDWNKPPLTNAFYDQHFVYGLTAIIQLGICGFGILAALSEKFQSVLIFSILVTVLWFYRIIVMFMTFLFIRMISNISHTTLVVVSWIYLFFIYLTNKEAKNDNPLSKNKGSVGNTDKDKDKDKQNNDFL